MPCCALDGRQLEGCGTKKRNMEAFAWFVTFTFSSCLTSLCTVIWVDCAITRWHCSALHKIGLLHGIPAEMQGVGMDRYVADVSHSYLQADYV
jgi:hypothetical protein